MKDFFEKMKEYLNMDSEIPFEEFNDYYTRYIEFLKGNFESLNEEESLEGLLILNSLKSNSEDRAKRKGKEAKKYNKMFERTGIWAGAMFQRLVKLGLSEKEIEARYEALGETV